MEHPLKNLGGIFSPELLARLLCLKYDFSMPENRQIRLLAREGIHISNTTLNSYIHNGISRLREFMEDVFKKFVQQAKYLMVDETTELVGVETPEGKAYRRKYLCILWDLYPQTDIRFTGCMTEKNQKCFI